jgi:PAS domain S-box-containing protein
MNAAPGSLRKRPSLFQLRTAILSCLVAVVCYYAVVLVDLLGIPPKHFATYWPTTPFLVAVLLFSSRRIWPVLIVAGLGGIALADLWGGWSIRSETLLTLGNLAEILIAALLLTYLFKGPPQVRSVKALAKYFLVAVTLAPFISALVGSIVNAPGGYWLEWKVWFFADALGFLTVTPAILSWVQEGQAWSREPKNYIELAALLTSLIGCGYITFMGIGRWQSPALLYSLVPILLWAALRLGLKGVSTSMVVIAFLSIWGATNDRGPFTGQGPFNNALSIQIFLFFAATSFMVLAVLVEEQKRAQQVLADEGAQLAEAQRLAQVGSWWWDPKTDIVTWSDQVYRIAGRDPRTPAPSFGEHPQLFTSESWETLERAVRKTLATGEAYEVDLEMVRPDGTTRWLMGRGEAERDAAGRIAYLRGTIKDITERKQFEKSLLWRLELERLISELSRTFINLPATEVDSNIERSLARIGGFLKIDRVALFEFSQDHTELTLAHSWSAFGVTGAPASVPIAELSWWRDRVLRGEEALTSQVDDMPEDASAEKEYFRHRGITSAASIPLKEGGEINGMISFIAVKRQLLWAEDLVNQLRVIADILWNALKRKRTVEALLATQAIVSSTEERFQLAMNNIASGVYTLDLQGLVTYMNPVAEALFGWTSAELLGKRMHDMTHYQHPDGTPFPASECPGVQALQQGIGLREQEDVFIRKDGTFFPVVYSVSPVKKGSETIGIVVGFRDDTQRRHAESAIRESEERFRLVANTAPIMIWMSGADKLCNYFNRGWLEFTGRPLEKELGNGWAEGLYPEDLQRCLNTYITAFDERQPFRMEYRLKRHDGQYRWIFDHGVPRFNADGSLAGYIGSCFDVTERKLAEEALSKVSQRLIEAQEEERARIARELHDDIGQRVALLIVNLAGLKRRHPASEPGIEEARKQLGELGDDIQALSHRLHSSKLEVLGLAAAAGGFCREFSDLQKVTIDFRAEYVPKDVPPEISLSLFRVLQEALQNATKHSGSRNFQVRLQGGGGEIELAVQDSGGGFELEQALKGRGLGLTSIRERLKLVDGHLSIDSNPQRGTTLRARVPMHSQSKSAT